MCSLLAACRSWFVFVFVLVGVFVVWILFVITGMSLFVGKCLMFVVCWVVVYGLLCVVCCSLFVVHYVLLSVVCEVLCVDLCCCRLLCVCSA